MNLAEHLRRRAAAHPGRAAVVERGRILTFGELEEAARRACSLLRRARLEEGDAVLVLLPMCCELYTALIAIFRLGLTAVFLDPSAGREHIAGCCAMRPPKALIAGTAGHLLRIPSEPLRRIATKFSVGLPVPGAQRWEAHARLSPLDEMLAAGDDAPALITFTSGTTGSPKGALRTHGQLLAQYEALRESLDLEEGEVDLTTLPVFLLANLASGITSVIPDGDLRRPGAMDMRGVLRQLRIHAPTRCAASPAFLLRLVEECARRGESAYSLKKIYAGGAPVFPSLLDELRIAAPAAAVTAIYGSTEAEPIARLPLDEVTSEDREAIAAGRGLPAGRPEGAVDLRIVADRWGSPLGALSAAQLDGISRGVGETGEIVVSGAHVLKGYLDGVGDGETKFPVDATVWHRTGDAGSLDGAGRLWLAGRCAEKMEGPRGRLYPLAVEAAAHERAVFARCAALLHRGRRVLAVEAKRGAPVPDGERLQKELAWAALDEVRLLPSIPVDRRHNAKVDYEALRRLLR